MEKKDIVRHRLVTRIVNAYERADKSVGTSEEKHQNTTDKQ
jgi:phosphate starvation-inducible protein PhoH